MGKDRRGMNRNAKTTNRWTVRDVLEWTASHFEEKGVLSARLDADILLAHALNADRMYLYLNLDRPLLRAERDRFRELVLRRAKREPVAFITGIKEFRSLPIRVAPGVLIPRPETETLVHEILAEIEGVDEPRILEIGTGSGAVSIAVAKEMSTARILATDLDPDALTTARSNAEELGADAAIRFLVSDLFSEIPENESFDLICSNPPYIPTRVIDTLEPEIARYEPRLALDGGEDGLDVIRRLASRARDFLKDSGVLILEIGDDQEDAVKEILAGEGRFGRIDFGKDLAGKTRVATARL
jgi:release factor glutamine methyltransferase